MSVDEAVDVPQPDDPDSPRRDPHRDPRSRDGASEARGGIDDDAPAGVTPILEDLAEAAEMDPDLATRRILTMVRRVAIGAWFVLVAVHIALEGLAFDRTRLIIIMCLGLAAACIGRRKVITVIKDWAPFALILILYDWTRDVARIVDMPTHWHLANDADKWMFGGIQPTAWLQDHLKEAAPPWWEVIVSVVYMSYFIVPYAVAAVLWLKNRSAWRRYAACFVATTFLALIGYTLVPAAPPWAAARCTAAEVVDNPRHPICMNSPQATEAGGILGPLDNADPGAAPYVERISARGWGYLNIHAASNLVEVGQGKSNLVAAIPSLHAGLTMLLALFMWPRVKALGRTLFVGYAFAMAFALVYTAEHYVFDIVLGWALAAAVVAVSHLVDRRWIQPRQERKLEEMRRAANPDGETGDPETTDPVEVPERERGVGSVPGAGAATS